MIYYGNEGSIIWLGGLIARVIGQQVIAGVGWIMFGLAMTLLIKF